MSRHGSGTSLEIKSTPTRVAPMAMASVLVDMEGHHVEREEGAVGGSRTRHPAGAAAHVPDNHRLRDGDGVPAEVADPVHRQIGEEVLAERQVENGLFDLGSGHHHGNGLPTYLTIRPR